MTSKKNGEKLTAGLFSFLSVMVLFLTLPVILGALEEIWHFSDYLSLDFAQIIRNTFCLKSIYLETEENSDR